MLPVTLCPLPEFSFPLPIQQSSDSPPVLHPELPHLIWMSQARTPRLSALGPSAWSSCAKGHPRTPAKQAAPQGTHMWDLWLNLIPRLQLPLCPYSPLLVFTALLSVGACGGRRATTALNRERQPTLMPNLRATALDRSAIVLRSDRSATIHWKSVRSHRTQEGQEEGGPIQWSQLHSQPQKPVQGQNP